jgi:hypothetical protein
MGRLPGVVSCEARREIRCDPDVMAFSRSDALNEIDSALHAVQSSGYHAMPESRQVRL